MVFAFIGEAVASGIIGKIAEAAYTAVEEKLLPPSDVETELERLQLALPQIKAVLCTVESGEIRNRNEALTAWMWQFRDAVEYAEDVLDEMAYYELEEKIQSQKGDPSSTKRKFFEFVGSKFKVDNHGILGRLEKAVKALDKVASSVRNFLDLERGLGGFRGKNSKDNDVENDRETGNMLTESVVFGREKERDLIVEWLIADPSVGDASLSTFTIYGIGGVGKTTLAQLIHEDERVKHFFYPIFWVCVSDQFDAVTIIAKILEVMSRESSLTTLQNNLKKQLISKRFLLVLDDVWNDENRSQWEKLVAPLKFGQGKILVTTRMESVADMVAKVIEGKTDRHKLEGLEEKDYFMLFNKHAFDGADPNEFRNLLPIGKQIAMKLGGCPLAAKIMGGVLNYSIEFEYWNKVLKEDVPDFQTGKDGIILVLRLSYCHLPTYLQLCFRYCSIFPKDYEFKKDKLIKMWIGSGLIEHVHKRQRPEDVGMEYFNRLVRKSFFDLNSKNVYVMHDLLHDLAQSVSEGECLQIEGSSSDIPRTIRYLSFSMESLLAIREISHLKSLRMLFVSFEGDIPDSSDVQIFGEVLNRLKSLRLLRIKMSWRGMFKVPDEIGELIHLRYLSLECNSATEMLPWFPVSVFKLYHLELIKFKSCINDIEEYETSEIVNLVKLRYLYVGVEILSQIANIGKLTFLQELEPFNIGPESGHIICELRDLRFLRKLAITNLDKVSNLAEAKGAKLYVKENLNNLSLSWPQENSVMSCTQEYEQLLDNLQPHKHLQELVIIGYGGMRSPIWMTHLFLRNLISLELTGCFRLTNLPALGNLPLLKKLKLFSLPQVKKVDQTLYGNNIECAFPVLKVLSIFGMEELEYWDEVQGIILFPRLESLHVSDCPKLRRLPNLSPSLKELDIKNVGLEILPRIYPSNSNGMVFLSSLSCLRVRDCPNLTSLEGCLLQQQEEMQALSELYIDNCEGLMYVPLRGFIDFTSLKAIFIGNCPILVGAPHTQQNLLPSSLQCLTVRESLDIPLLGSVRNCTALTKLILNGCPNISSLPPFEIMSKLIALNNLSINYCPELSSLGGLEAVTSLRYLYINNCDKLITISLSQPPLSENANDSNLLQLDMLVIDCTSLILLKPLRSLRLTKGLHITNASGLTCMPEEWLMQNHGTLRSIIVQSAANLELLPSCMDKLALLERLEVHHVPLIQSLPHMPPSLNYLHITGCHPLLMERYGDDSGPEWYRIAHIASVGIRSYSGGPLAPPFYLQNGI